MKTGFARLRITPPFGTPIAGYYEKRSTKGVLDDLYITVVALDDGESKALLMCAVLLNLTTAQNLACRKVISEYCGIPV